MTSSSDRPRATVRSESFGPRSRGFLLDSPGGSPSQATFPGEPTSSSPSSPHSPHPHRKGLWKPFRQTSEARDSVESTRDQHNSSPGGSSSGSRPTVSEGAVEPESERSVNAARMGAILMNIKYSRLNDVDEVALATQRPRVMSQAARLAQVAHKTPHISAGTRARALKTKANLELKYQMLSNYQQRIIMSDDDRDEHDEQDHELQHEHNEDHENEHGVHPNSVNLHSSYNPLQILRNRPKRQSRHAFPNHPGQPAHWTIDASETVRDFAWRDQNLGQLTDRKGRPVYPSMSDWNASSHADRLRSSSSSGKQYSPDELLQRLKLKLNQKNLLTGNDTDSSISRSERSGDSEMSDSGNAGTNTPMSGPQVSKKARRTSVSPVRAVRIEPLPLVSRNSYSAAERLNPPVIRVESTPPLSPSPPQASIPTSPAPMEIATPLSHSGNSTVNITDRELPTTAATNTSQTKVGALSGSEKSPVMATMTDPGASKSMQYSADLRYFETMYYISMISYYNIVERFEKSLDEKQVVGDINAQIDQATKQVSGDLVPQSQRFVSDRSPIVAELRRVMLQEKTSILDSILVDSDRVLGEASTTLNLEVRRIGERIGRLEKRASAMKLVYSVGYSVLAWTLMVVMWICWMVISLLLLFRGTIKLGFKVVKWLLWC